MLGTHTAYRQSTKYKNAIRERDNHVCQLCGDYGNVVDHIVPFAVSHDSSPDNLRVLCRACNLKTRRKRYDARRNVDDWDRYLAEELAKYKG